MFNSGASSGARDPFSQEAADSTPVLYEEIKKDQRDCSHIAANQKSYSYEKIVQIKNHVFYQKHMVDGEYKLFDQDYMIAVCWRRLAYQPKLINDMDMTLLDHEYAELTYMRNGISYHEAHLKANETANFKAKVLDFEKSHKLRGKPLNSAKYLDQHPELMKADSKKSEDIHSEPQKAEAERGTPKSR